MRTYVRRLVRGSDLDSKRPGAWASKSATRPTMIVMGKWMRASSGPESSAMVGTTTAMDSLMKTSLTERVTPPRMSAALGCLAVWTVSGLHARRRHPHPKYAMARTMTVIVSWMRRSELDRVILRMIDAGGLYPSAKRENGPPVSLVYPGSKNATAKITTAMVEWTSPI